MSHAHFNPHLPFRCATLDLHGPRARGLRPGLGCAICGRRRRGWISIRRTAATSQNRVCTPKGATKKNRGPLANWTRWKSNYNGIVYNSKTVYIYIYMYTHIYINISPPVFFLFSSSNRPRLDKATATWCARPRARCSCDRTAWRP